MLSIRLTTDLPAAGLRAGDRLLVEEDGVVLWRVLRLSELPSELLGALEQLGARISLPAELDASQAPPPPTRPQSPDGSTSEDGPPLRVVR